MKRIDTMALFILPANAVRLNLQRRLPDPHLRPWVQCLWSMAGHSGVAAPETEKLYPDAGSSLTIKLTSPRPTITFCFNKSTLFETFDPTTARLSIRFKAAGAFALLGIEPQRFSNLHHSLDIDDHPLWLNSLMPVVDRLYEVSALEGLALLERWLLGRLEFPTAGHTRTQHLVHEIGRLQLPPQALMANLGFTRRTLERRLKREVGVSPGHIVGYARMYTARRLLSTPHPCLAEVALRCGYYDQAHFSHAFHAFTHETPAAYRKRKLSQIYKA